MSLLTIWSSILSGTETLVKLSGAVKKGYWELWDTKRRGVLPKNSTAATHMPPRFLEYLIDLKLMENRLMSESRNTRENLRKFLEKRDALFRNPTLEGAKAYYEQGGLEIDWARPDVPLAALHKARLQWLEATDAMIDESRTWLTTHGYADTWHQAPPLTPERRDADRVSLGKKPLNEQ
jgi:hypothetical protein